MNIRVKRIYEAASRQDGARWLVDRLWPRGLKKEDAGLDGWLKEASPSHGLRRWFAHEPKKWAEFKRRYFEELAAHPSAWQPILKTASQHTATLLFAAKDERHNNAVALKEFLESIHPEHRQ